MADRNKNRAKPKLDLPRDPKNGTFVKGSKGGPGRPKGVPNKVTQSMQDIVTQAGEKAGQIVQMQLQQRIDKRKNKEPTPIEQIILEAPPTAAYLLKQAEDNPPQFLALLKQLMPAKLDVEVTLQADDLIGLVHARREELAAMKAQVIEGIATEIEE